MTRIQRASSVLLVLACLVIMVVFASMAAAAAPKTVIRTPGDFEAQSRTLMAYPYHSTIWWSHLHGAQVENAAIANAISQFEPVTLFVDPSVEDYARADLGSGSTVNVVTSVPYDDDWVRDTCGPLVFVNGKQTVEDWVFNCWGQKFPYWKTLSQLDDALPIPVSQYLGMPRRPIDMVLEGGSVLFDGQGTCFTTSMCLLNPNRNPGMTKAQIEAKLKTEFGCTKVIWLPYGDPTDWITDGHVDGAMLVVGAPTSKQGAEILVQRTPTSDPSYAQFEENIAVLQAATDAKGRKFRLRIFDILGKLPSGPEVLNHSYINVKVCNNGGIVMPLLGDPAQDVPAVNLMKQLLPGRTVVGVAIPDHTWAGGGPHCITKEVWR